MQIAAGSDWIIDMGPGAGDEGGRIAASGVPADVKEAGGSRTARYLKKAMAG